MKRREHSRVNIRHTHPGLYHALMNFAVVEVALALNFWFGPPPAFKPYSIPMYVIGVVFFMLGSLQLVFLNVLRDLRKVRLALAVSVGFTFFWAIANTQQVLAGRASWQLPIIYGGMCFAQIPWLIEAPRNATTERA